MTKKLNLLMIPVLVLALAAAGWMFMRQAPAAPGERAATPGPVHTMAEPFVVNLAGSPEVPRFVKVGVALRLAESSADRLTPATAGAPGRVEDEPQVRDIVISALQRRSGTDLSTERGRAALKREIVRTVNRRTDLRILDVYYTEFAVQ